jgi:hypothetical protein
VFRASGGIRAGSERRSPSSPEGRRRPTRGARARIVSRRRWYTRRKRRRGRVDCSGGELASSFGLPGGVHAEAMLRRGFRVRRVRRPLTTMPRPARWFALRRARRTATAGGWRAASGDARRRDARARTAVFGGSIAGRIWSTRAAKWPWAGEHLFVASWRARAAVKRSGCRGRSRERQYGNSGWRLIAPVDTRPARGDGGGQYASVEADDGGMLGVAAALGPPQNADPRPHVLQRSTVLPAGPRRPPTRRSVAARPRRDRVQLA